MTRAGHLTKLSCDQSRSLYHQVTTFCTNHASAVAQIWTISSYLFSPTDIPGHFKGSECERVYVLRSSDPIPEDIIPETGPGRLVVRGTGLVVHIAYRTFPERWKGNVIYYYPALALRIDKREQERRCKLHGFTSRGAAAAAAVVVCKQLDMQRVIMNMRLCR